MTEYLDLLRRQTENMGVRRRSQPRVVLVYDRNQGSLLGVLKTSYTTLQTTLPLWGAHGMATTKTNRY